MFRKVQQISKSSKKVQLGSRRFKKVQKDMGQLRVCFVFANKDDLIQEGFNKGQVWFKKVLDGSNVFIMV